MMPVSPGPQPAPAHVFVPFFAGSLLLTLTFGATLGMINLARLTGAWGWGALPPSSIVAHAYVQVFGFLTLFVMGVAYHVLPRFANTTLQRPRLVAWSFWLQVSGVLAVAVGFFLDGRATPPLWIAGGALLLAAALIFCNVILHTLRATAPSTEPFRRWVGAGSVWLVVAATLALVAAVSDDVTWHRVLWTSALFGFTGSWIFGIGRRILPIFLGCRPQWPRAEVPVFAAYQLGAIGWSIGAWPATGEPATSIRALGAVLLISSVIGYTGVIQLPDRAVSLVRTHGHDRSPHDGWQRYVFAAWGWLAVALAVGPGWTLIRVFTGGVEPILLLDFARHAMAFGFATQMVLGVASRVVPNFTGNPLWSPAARDATFWCLNASIIVRALEVPVATGWWAAAWPGIAWSGPPAVLAIALFAANIMMTVRGDRSVAAGRAAPR